MEEKIKKLKDYGIKIIVFSPGQGCVGCSHNEIYIGTGWTDREVEELIDKKLKFFEDNKWPLLLKKFSDPSPKSKCETCQNYAFTIQSDGESGRMVTWENCTFGHFRGIIKEQHEPVIYCKNYE